MKRHAGTVLAILFVATAAVPAAPPLPSTLDWRIVREGMPALNGIAANGSVYVMVGDYGEVYTSTNAVDWARQNPDPAHRNLRGITYDGSRFVAVGDPWAWARLGGNSAVAMASTDGTASAWVFGDTGTAGQGVGLAAVAFGSGRYVAVGDRGKVLCSTDAATWSAVTSGTTQNLTGVAFGAGVFVAVGQNRTVVTSSDCASWSPVTPAGVSANALIRGVAYTGSLFAAAGRDDSGPLLMTSPDGSSWTPQTPSLGWGYSGVGAGNGMAVATSWGFVATSSDGMKWDWRPLPDDESIDDTHTGVEHVAFGPAGFVACGETGALYTAPNDASSWTRRTLEASRQLGALVEGDGVLCATGRSIARSTDNGATWTDSSVPEDSRGASSVAAYDVAYGSGRFVIVTENDLYSSTNCGPDWEEAQGTRSGLPGDWPAIGFSRVAFGAGRFVAVGSTYDSDSGTMSMLLDTSTDGVTWTRLDAGVPEGYKYPGVAYANGRFVLVVFYAFNGGPGPTPLYLTSQDGLNWAPGTWPFPHPGRDGWEIRSVGDRFFATGGWTSLDGLVWTQTAPASTPLAYGAGRWLSGGSDGSIEVSTDLLNWTTNATGTHRALGAAVYLASVNRFVAVGDSVIVRSSEPTAEAGPDQTLEVALPGGATVALDGSSSFDPEGDPLVYEWQGPFGSASGATVSVTLPLGTHSILLTVRDNRGGVSSDEVTVTVQDTTPPAINGASAKPAILSPPTGKMTTVTINYTAIDNNGSATCHLGPVTCNEAITSADWRILDTHRVQLTATRKGNGSGRIYTIPITCLDPSGNSARRTVTVIVPRGLGK